MGRALTSLVLALFLAACDGSGIVIGDAHVDRDGTLPDVDAGDPCDSYTDSDGDTIPDSVEGTGDYDGDTIPSMLDDDSDGDTIPDSVEAGDDDLCTPPVNSDWRHDDHGFPTGDDLPDFLDSDSDDDGLTDAEERERGTERVDTDTDDDGYSDFVEVILESDPLDPASRPDPDTIIVELPYLYPDHEYRTPTFGTEHRVADVYFLVDTNISMRESIEWLDTLFASNVVTALREAIPDVEMGVGHFNDVPRGAYGSVESQPFRHVQDITSDHMAVHEALGYLHGSSFPFGGESDPPQSQVIALACAASGDGFADCSSAVPPASCPVDHVGTPCFRPGALPVIVMVSDASWHGDDLGLNPYDCTETDFDAALESLLEIDARFIGVHVGTDSEWGHRSMSQMALETGTVDARGIGLVSAEDPSTVSTSIADLFSTLVDETPMDVRVIPVDEPDDPPEAEYDATVFLKDATPVTGFPDAPEGFESMDHTFFFDTVPGTALTFELDFYNNTVEGYDKVLAFKFWIVVLGNGVEHIEAWPVYVFVPVERGGWFGP